jgi:hypothetical protein
MNTFSDSSKTGKHHVTKDTACRHMPTCASKAFCTLMRASTSGNCEVPCRIWHQQLMHRLHRARVVFAHLSRTASAHLQQRRQ